ncbi:hypothetical protein BTO30_12520 [Domibacillus antri]|uniref:DUF4352 domain-containing protein n=1 Tax=Domibacillus antri TaxID=1714264 RepID=A0A1Q8Q3P3_9BACI|nr:hypothetical protein [Domibacillus antri]OLN21915.1 hypothetical protein BTO30_12520 [Domibacillus antri]
MGKFFKIGCIGLVVIFLLLVVLVMFSSSDEDSEVTVTDNSDSQSDTASTEIETTEEEPAESKEVGSRSNPVPLGSTATITGNIYDEESNSFDATVDITIKEVKRGQEVLDILKAENEFNEDPADGFEYMMVTVEANVKEAGTEDFAFLISNGDFDFISEDGKTYEMISVVTPDELFEEIYSGGTSGGNFVGQVKIGEKVTLGYEDGDFKNVFFATQ